MNKLQIKISNIYEPKQPIKSPGFLNWLRKKRRQRQKQKQQEQKQKQQEQKQKQQEQKQKQQKQQEIKKKKFRYKKIVFARIKQHAKWCKIKKIYIYHKGEQPPFLIKDWFFNY
jgi:hypothetical protein